MSSLSLCSWSASSRRFFGHVLRQLEVAVCAAIAVALVVVHHPLTYSGIGRILVCLGQRGVDLEAARVGLVLVTLVDRLAHHFREEIRARRELRLIAPYDHWLVSRFFELRGLDEVRVRACGAERTSGALWRVAYSRQGCSVTVPWAVPRAWPSHPDSSPADFFRNRLGRRTRSHMRADRGKIWLM